MPSLSAATVTAQISYAFSKNITGIGPVKTDTLTSGLKVSPTIGTVANSGIAEQLTLAASGTSTIDLNNFTDPFGDAGVATKALGLLLVPTGANVILSPGGSNPEAWFLGGTTPTVTIPAGGVFLYFEPVGTTVDSTHKTLLLTNASSTVACVVTVVVLVKA